MAIKVKQKKESIEKINIKELPAGTLFKCPTHFQYDGILMLKTIPLYKNLGGDDDEDDEYFKEILAISLCSKYLIYAEEVNKDDFLIDPKDVLFGKYELTYDSPSN